jgi:hypothetical protein
MISRRFLLTVICLGVCTSFVPIRRFNAIQSRILRLSEETSDPASSIQNIINQFKAIPLTVSTKKQEVIDTFQRSSEMIQAAPGKFSRNVKLVSDAVIYFPSNVTASVSETRSNIQETTDNITKTVKALSPLPFIQSTVTFFKSVIDTTYELKEGKIKGGDVLAKFKKPEPVKEVKVLPRKSNGAIYEEVKEGFYSTIDNINGFGTGVQAAAGRLQQLPSDISTINENFTKTKENLAVTAEMLQKDALEKQEQAGILGKVVWKILTLEAAKETFERTEKKYRSAAKYATETVTILKTNPTSIFKSRTAEKKVEAIIATKKIVEKKDDSALGKVWGVLRATKDGLDATISTVSNVSNGVQGLKKRIDKNLATQAATSKSKQSTVKKSVVPSSISSPIINTDTPVNSNNFIESVSDISTDISTNISSDNDVKTDSFTTIATEVKPNDLASATTDSKTEIFASSAVDSGNMNDSSSSDSNLVTIEGPPPISARKNYSGFYKKPS